MNRTELASELARLAEDDLVACLISSGCVGTVKMSFESGPMDITRPSLNATKLARAILARAILALRPADVPTNGVAAVKTTGVADSPIPGTTVVAIATGDLNTEGRV